MTEFKTGDRIKYKWPISSKNGTVISADATGIRVRWDDGTESGIVRIDEKETK
jgi:hypothetical protein